MTGRFARLQKALLGSLRAVVATDSCHCAVAGLTTLCSDIDGHAIWQNTKISAGSVVSGLKVQKIHCHRTFSSLEAAAEPRQVTYYVEVITGDVRGAGTPAPAAITLFGEGTYSMFSKCQNCQDNY
jgi:hypothetical protein